MKTISTFTRNERKVLKILLDDARVSDSDIAAKMKITPQGVRKIRKKLEGGIIESYRPVLDYESMGIRVFAVAHVRIHNRESLKSEHIIGAFEINEASISHIFILGFASLEQLDKYKVAVASDLDLQQIHVVSRKGFLKNSPTALLLSQLKDQTHR